MDRGLNPRLRAAVAAAIRAGVLLLVVAAATFVLADVLPGDAAGRNLGRDADAEALARARAESGEDRPLPARLALWLADAVRGDLGTTARGRPVTEVVIEPFGRTLALGAAAMVVVAVVGVGLGVALAMRAGSVADQVGSSALSATLGLPEFVLASILVLVGSTWLDLVPPVVVVRGDGHIPFSMMVIPIIALSLPSIAWTARGVRGAMLDALALPHVEAARLDGLRQLPIALGHALPVAVPSIAAVLATSAVTLVGGAVVVERFVNYPGLGSVLAAAVDGRDIALATGCVVLVSAVIIVVLALADLARAWGTPR